MLIKNSKTAFKNGVFISLAFKKQILLQ